MLSLKWMCITCAPLFPTLRSIWFASLIPFLPLLILLPPSVLPRLQLSIQARSEVIKRATKALRQLGEKSRKRGGDGGGEQEGTDPAGMTFDEALAHLQQSQAHLDTLSHAFILSLKDGQQVDPICQTLKQKSSLYSCFSINCVKWVLSLNGESLNLTNLEETLWNRIKSTYIKKIIEWLGLAGTVEYVVAQLKIAPKIDLPSLAGWTWWYTAPSISPQTV